MKVGLAFTKITSLYESENVRNEHIGLGYLANALKVNNYIYKIIDGHFWGYDVKKMVEIIIKEKFDVIGFSVLYSNFEETITVIDEIIRVQPHVKFIIGGQHATFCAEEILEQNPNVYCVIRGEGEITLIKLLEAIKNKKDLAEIDGITYRNNGVIVENISRRPELDIEKYGTINRDILEESLKANNIVTLNVMAGRGCHFTCSFCTGNKIFNPFQDCGWRVKTL